MKNLKKVLALVLALSMILSTFTALTLTASAAAEPTFSDIAGTSYEDAVEVLAALDIVAGYEDGTFGGDKVVTRAEMAAFIVRELGLAATASSATSGNQYSDVAADHWALGSINIATQKKIIVGNGDGTFAPNDTVSYQAAVKMLVCALGYEVVANRNGGWPSGYLIQGAALGLTDGITGIDGADGCNRGVVASLLYNALEIDLMEEVTYSGSAVQQETTDKTLLYNNLGVNKYYDAEITNTTTQGNSKTAAGFATIAGTWDVPYYGAYKTNNLKVQVGETDPDAFYGDAVIIYAKRSVNSNIADTMLCIINDNTTQESMEIDVADFYSSNFLLFEGDSNTEGKNTSDKYARLYYKGEEDTKAQYAKLLDCYNYGDGCELVINGYVQDSADWGILAALENGTVKLVDAKTYDFNDMDSTAGADGYYEKVVIDTYFDFVVSEVDADENKIITLNEIDVTLDDSIIYTLTDAEGNELKLEDLQENDVLSIFPDTWTAGDTVKSIVEGAEVLKVVVYNNPLEGTVTELTSKAVFIDGTKYEVAGDLAKLSDFELGDEGTFYLNAAGDIVYSDTSAAAKDYAVFYDVYKSNNRQMTFNVITSAGEELEFTASALDVVEYGVNGSGVYGKAKTTEYDFTNAADMAAAEALLATAGESYSPYIAKYSLKNGSTTVIDTIYLAGSKKGATSFKNDRFAIWETSYDGYYNSNESTFGGYMVDASTVIFDIPSSVTSVKDSDKIKILSKSGLKNSETYKDTQIYEVDKNNVIKAAIIHSSVSDVDVNDPIAIIQAVSKAKNADGEDIYKVYMIQNGKAVVKETEDDKIFDAPAGLDEKYTQYSIDIAYGVYPGSVIMYNEAANGAIDAVQRIYPTTSYTGDEEDDVPYYKTELYTTWNLSAHKAWYTEGCDAFIVVGVVADKSTANKTITVASKVKVNEKDKVEDYEDLNTIANYASANITVVDYDFEETEDIVAAGSASDIEEGSLVLVRKADGATKDIVVYKDSYKPETKPLV